MELRVAACGHVIKSAGSYILSGNTLFSRTSSSPAEECLDDNGVQVAGLLILADDVQLDFRGHTLALNDHLLREFSCVVIRGNRVSLSGGNIGRASACCIECTGSDLNLQEMSLSDFEVGGALILTKKGLTQVQHCVIGPSFKGRRLSGEDSLVARYLPLVPSLAQDLLHAVSQGPLRSDTGTVFGLAILAGGSLKNSLKPSEKTAAKALVEGVTLREITCRSALLPFLSYSMEDLPSGQLKDAIPLGGASELRKHAQSAVEGLLGPAEKLPEIKIITRSGGCSTSANNFGTCSTPQFFRENPPSAKVFSGLDFSGQRPQGVHGLWLHSLCEYTVSNLTVTGLSAAASLQEKNILPIGVELFRISSSSKLGFSAFTLVSCAGGLVNDDVPEALMIDTVMPQGYLRKAAVCSLPISGAWLPSTGASSFQAAQPVGNAQNRQVRPVFLPSLATCPQFIPNPF
jgi:hypothetical protein